MSADGHAGGNIGDYRPYLDGAVARRVRRVGRRLRRCPTRICWATTARATGTPIAAVRDLEADGQVAEVIFPNTVPPFFPKVSLTTQPPADHRRGCRAPLGRPAGAQPVARRLLRRLRRAGAPASCRSTCTTSRPRWPRSAGRTAPGSTRRRAVAGHAAGHRVCRSCSTRATSRCGRCAKSSAMPVNHHTGSASPPMGPTDVDAVDVPARGVVVRASRAHPSHRRRRARAPSRAAAGVHRAGHRLGARGAGEARLLLRPHGRRRRFAGAGVGPGGRRAAVAASRASTGPASATSARASSARPRCRCATAVGVDRIMWGSDYPHKEASHAVFARGDALAVRRRAHGRGRRCMLGGNAAALYGFDLDALAPLAAQYGPRVADVDRPLQPGEAAHRGLQMPGVRPRQPTRHEPSASTVTDDRSLAMSRRSPTTTRTSSSRPTATPGCPPSSTASTSSTKFHPAFDEFLAERAAMLEAATKMGVRDDTYAKKWFEEHDEELAGGWDAIKRDQALDADGVAGEVVYPDADAVESRTCVPFGAGLGLTGRPRPRARAGGRARRTTAGSPSCARHSPERRCGVALGADHRSESTTCSPRSAGPRSHGLGAVMIPALWCNQTPYHDRRYDPVWALCEELADADRDPLGRRRARRVRRPPRHLRHRGHVVAGAPDVVPACGRACSSASPGCASASPRAAAGGCRSCCGRGTACSWARKARRSSARDAFNGSVVDAAERVRRPQLLHRPRQRQAARARHALRDRHRQHVVGHRLPAPRGHLARTPTSGCARRSSTSRSTRRGACSACSAAEVFGFDLDKLAPLAEKIGPTPTDLGQLGEGRPRPISPPAGRR